MMPCRPAMTFCSIVGHASRHTAGPMGPSTIERSNRLALTRTSVTKSAILREVTVLGRARPSDVQLLGVLGAVHDETEAGGRVLAHQLVDDAIGDDLIGNLDPLQTAALRVERGFPQHLRQHLPQPLE